MRPGAIPRETIAKTSNPTRGPERENGGHSLLGNKERSSTSQPGLDPETLAVHGEDTHGLDPSADAAVARSYTKEEVVLVTE